MTSYEETRDIVRALPDKVWLKLRGEAVSLYLESDIHPEGEGLGSSDMFHITCNALFNGDVEIPECEGHESLAGSNMGETVYCDGSCL